MKEDIKKKSEGCSICLTFNSSKQDEEKMEERHPERPMDFVSMDLFT